jgi:putative phosphoribosyl transferase
VFDLPRFVDRDQAGRRLGTALRQYARDRDLIVLALPRGGVPVGARIAEALNAPLDVCIVRKWGTPDTKSWRWAPSPAAALAC